MPKPCRRATTYCHRRSRACYEPTATLSKGMRDAASSTRRRRSARQPAWSATLRSRGRAGANAPPTRTCARPAISVARARSRAWPRAASPPRAGCHALRPLPPRPCSPGRYRPPRVVMYHKSTLYPAPSTGVARSPGGARAMLTGQRPARGTGMPGRRPATREERPGARPGDGHPPVTRATGGRVDLRSARGHRWSAVPPEPMPRGWPGRG